MTPEALPGIHAVDFSAPPPSPVAPGRRSSFANDDVLTEYLQQSLKVPDLILPDKAFPRQKSHQSPPKIDFQNLDESGVEISQLIAQLGCLQVINHGISRDLIKFVLELGNGVFDIPPEKKRTVARSPERRYGFEEIHEEEEQIRDQTEEFIWSEEEAMRQEMEGIWPFRYSNFSQEMKNLSTQMGEIGRKVLQFLQQHSHSLLRICPGGNALSSAEASGNICCVQKQWRRNQGLSGMNSVRYDVIRMLIRGSEFPHALCLHICSGAAEFHVYSRKGWVSFCPHQDSIVVTVGDNLQAWSGGQYKHVIGRPVFKGEDEACSHISMGFLYSSPNMKIKDDKDMTISVSNQIILAIILTLVYQFAVYALSYKK